MKTFRSTPPPLDIARVTSSPSALRTFTSTPLGHCPCDVIPHSKGGGGVIGPYQPQSRTLCTHSAYRFPGSGQVQGAGGGDHSRHTHTHTHTYTHTLDPPLSYNAPYRFLPYCRNPHVIFIPASSNEEQYKRQLRSPYLESYVEDLCSPHDSSILLGMAHGTFCL